MNKTAQQTRIIAFDVFGTVVDWHGSVSREVGAMKLGVDAGKFALAWRAGYKPAMQAVMDRGEWIILDLDTLGETERNHLNQVWHRLDPWPDSVEGLTRLKSRYIICSLSNGNIGLLTDMAKKAGLPWDCILSAENFNKYKPHPDTYRGVATTFAAEPSQVMFAAAHHSDLEHARNCGLETAYIERPFEYGRDNPKPVAPWDANTLHTTSIVDLAEQMGC
jgi:2-haloacid dehalogenase